MVRLPCSREHCVPTMFNYRSRKHRQGLLDLGMAQYVVVGDIGHVVPIHRLLEQSNPSSLLSIGVHYDFRSCVGHGSILPIVLRPCLQVWHVLSSGPNGGDPNRIRPHLLAQRFVRHCANCHFDLRIRSFPWQRVPEPQLQPICTQHQPRRCAILR